YIIGEENRGLACMFTMMNSARLAVGVQGAGIAERATQAALAYAHERRQGKALVATGEGMAPIVAHPDIRRTLMTMRAASEAARAICLTCAFHLDLAHAGGDDAARHGELGALWTPVAKAFATDLGVEVASMGIQVHGGMGVIEETGAAAYLRDARIAPIYEGT
ncbi:MAG: acyl-CoA dehydrogenase, partial [Hyphomicrobiaceae bacterium]|nr:acyl-CoA dehydrogenase [Hyphomicrobiaceae bacterium]